MFFEQPKRQHIEGGVERPRRLIQIAATTNARRTPASPATRASRSLSWVKPMQASRRHMGHRLKPMPAQCDRRADDVVMADGGRPS